MSNLAYATALAWTQCCRSNAPAKARRASAGSFFVGDLSTFFCCIRQGCSKVKRILRDPSPGRAATYELDG
ncbi:hypothetical protein, partial [Streptomyces sp. NPDC002666]